VRADKQLLTLAARPRRRCRSLHLERRELRFYPGIVVSMKSRKMDRPFGLSLLPGCSARLNIAWLANGYISSDADDGLAAGASRLLYRRRSKGN
jgi:hypothetical protein